MSDPSLVQITFMIKPNMPKDMKQLIFMCFTDYYEKYYPDKKPTHENYLKLGEKYPAIWDLDRNDAYHNVNQQICHLSEYDVYDLDTGEGYSDNRYYIDENDNYVLKPTPNIGVSILSLPRSSGTLDEFFKLVGPYIDSRVCTLGIQHYSDYGKTVAYYYMDKLGNIKKHMIQRAPEDEILFDNGLKKLNEHKIEVINTINNDINLSDKEKQKLLNEIDDYINHKFNEEDEDD